MPPATSTPALPEAYLLRARPKTHAKVQLQRRSRRRRPEATPAVLRMDPRIAKRRELVLAEQRSRHVRQVVVVLSILGAAGLAAGLLFSPVLGVRHVRIDVSGAFSALAVREAAGVRSGRPMLEVNGAQIASRVDAVPQLGGAWVRVLWPDTVSIGATVRKAAATVSLGTAGWAIVDPTGRVISDSSAKPVGLPVIEGLGSVPAPGGWLSGTGSGSTPVGGPPPVALDAAEGSPSLPASGSAVMAALDLMPEAARTDVVGVSVTGGLLSMLVSVGSASAGSSQVPVTFGDTSQLAPKLSALATLIEEGDLAGARGVDVSVPDRPTVLT